MLKSSLIQVCKADTTQRKLQFVIARPNRSRQIWSVSTPCQEQSREITSGRLIQLITDTSERGTRPNIESLQQRRGLTQEQLTNQGYILQVPRCVSYLSVMTVVSISMTACQTTSSCEWRLILIGSVSVDCLCGAIQWPRALLHVCPGHHTPIFHVRHPKPERHISSDAIRGKLALRPIYFTIIWILHQSMEFSKKCQTP